MAHPSKGSQFPGGLMMRMTTHSANKSFPSNSFGNHQFLDATTDMPYAANGHGDQLTVGLPHHVKVIASNGDGTSFLTDAHLDSPFFVTLSLLFFQTFALPPPTESMQWGKSSSLQLYLEFRRSLWNLCSEKTWRTTVEMRGSVPNRKNNHKGGRRHCLIRVMWICTKYHQTWATWTSDVHCSAHSGVVHQRDHSCS